MRKRKVKAKQDKYKVYLKKFMCMSTKPNTHIYLFALGQSVCSDPWSK